ncbi:MAG: hypothetical protein AB7K68_00695 [Bacteriovoracia bacterium]
MKFPSIGRFLSVFLLSSLFSPLGGAEPVSLAYSPECILESVARKKNIALDAGIAIPSIYVESKTPLSQFQDAIEPQWGIRPDSFSNAFAYARNEIYLIDDGAYYARHGRFMDDSLAHELAHFIQYAYQHADFTVGDESLESEAVDIQDWFRRTFMATGQSPCASRGFTRQSQTTIK